MINVFSSTLKRQGSFLDLNFSDRSISPIDKFNPVLIKEVVDSLVMAKYATFIRRTSRISSGESTTSDEFTPLAMSFNSIVKKPKGIRRNMGSSGESTSSSSSDEYAQQMSLRCGTFVKEPTISSGAIGSSSQSTSNYEYVEPMTSKRANFVKKPVRKSRATVNLNKGRTSFDSIEFTGQQENSPFDSDLSIHTSNMSLLISTHFLAREHESSLNYDSFGISASPYIYMEPIYEKLTATARRRDQVLKAIFFDDLHKRTELSMERIEAERLLLILDVEAEIILQNVKKSLHEVEDSLHTATINLSHLQFWIQEKRCSNDYFLAVITHGSQVFATEVTKAKTNDMIYMKDNFFIKGCTPSSTIEISLYSIRRGAKLLGWSNKLVCHYQKFDTRTVDIPERSSSFELLATSKFSCMDLKNLSTSRGMKWFENCWFKSEIHVKAELCIALNEFLNVSKNSEGYPVWNTQWCVLKENLLKIYNYPSDNMATEIINLEDCVEFKRLSKEECPRSNTIMLKTYTNGRYLICCHHLPECQKWEKALAEVISSLKIWGRAC